MAEYRNGRLQLPNVTLAAMASVNIRATVKALAYSCRKIDFGAVTFICHKKPNFLPKYIEYQHIDKIDGTAFRSGAGGFWSIRPRPGFRLRRTTGSSMRTDSSV